MKKVISSFFWIMNHPLNRKRRLAVIIRIILWKFNQLFLGIPVVVEMESGVKFKCYPDSSWSGLVIYTKLPEYFEMRYVQKLIRKNDVVIDVGSNMGGYSLICASRMEKGKVFSFEPSEKAYKRFLENIVLNKFGERVIPFNVAISDKESLLSFTNESTSETSHISYPDVLSFNIKSFTLDKFVYREKIKKIRLIKIDVEGYEYKVIKGLHNLLSKGVVDYLLVEVNKNSLRYGINPNKTIELLRSYGYKTFRFGNGPRLIPTIRFLQDKWAYNIVAARKNIQIR